MARYLRTLPVLVALGVAMGLQASRADEPSVALASTGQARGSVKDQVEPSGRRPARLVQRASTAAQGDWLYAYVSRVNTSTLWNDIVGQPLPEQQLKWRRRAQAAAPHSASLARVARPGHSKPAPLIVARPEAPQAPVLKPSVATPVHPPHVPPVTVDPAPVPPREVTTGTLQSPQAPLDEEDILELAGRTQAALDLVKLELAARTYDEPKKAGERVFVERPDWKMLENALDSMNDGERSAATAAGFIAHAYVNDATRTIIVAVAGSQDLRRDFIAADVWQALIRSEAPQHFFLAKLYIRSVIRRFQLQGYVTECVGHSLGGGACAYAAAEIGVRAYVVNPISAGMLPPAARSLVTNYIVDGDIASIVYPVFGNEISGEIRRINNGRDRVRAAVKEKYGLLAGPILVIRDARAAFTDHKIDRALERIAVHAGVTRPR